MIDLLSVLPYWVEVLMNALQWTAMGGAGSALSGLIVLRVLRLLRLTRLFRVSKHGQTFILMQRTMTQSTSAIVVLCAILFMCLLLFGTFIWMSERGEWLPAGHPVLLDLDVVGRPGFVRNRGLNIDFPAWEESPFRSIVHSWWWVVITTTTVGFGDDYPVTGAGKGVGTFVAVVGVLVLSMPIGVIGTVFSEEFQKMQTENRERVKAQRKERRMVRNVLRNWQRQMAEGGPWTE